jgi:xanthine dehydrogenase YagS FAD-binding subunit
LTVFTFHSYIMQRPAATFEQAAKLALQEAKALADNQFKIELTQRSIRRALAISAQGGGIA